MKECGPNLKNYMKKYDLKMSEKPQPMTDPEDDDDMDDMLKNHKEPDEDNKSYKGKKK